MLRVWETPESLRTYFQGLAEKYPADPCWRNCAEAVQRWIYLIERQAFIRPEEVAGLMQLLVADRHAGSAWNDFEYHVWVWLRTLPPLLQAPAMCTYFAGLAAQQPDLAAAQRGWQAAEEWLRLVQAGHATMAEAKTLLANSAAYTYTSDAWFYLGQMIEAWQREQAELVYS